jgi:hypothetical protein
VREPAAREALARVKLLRVVATECLGLFVEDWPSALAIAVAIGAVALWSAIVKNESGYARAGLLFALLAAALVLGVVRSAQKVR